MARLFVSAFALGSLVATACDQTAIREADPDVASPASAEERHGEALIAGFDSVPWGSDLSTVIELHGDPGPNGIMDQTWGEQILYIPKFGSLYGEKSRTSLAVHSREGLFAGEYWLAFDSEALCEELYSSVHEEIAARFSTLQLEERKTTSTSYCKGVERGEPATYSVWRDEVGAEIQVGVQNVMVVVRFKAPEWDDSSVVAALRGWGTVTAPSSSLAAATPPTATPHPGERNASDAPETGSDLDVAESERPTEAPASPSNGTRGAELKEAVWRTILRGSKAAQTCLASATTGGGTDVPCSAMRPAAVEAEILSSELMSCCPDAAIYQIRGEQSELGTVTAWFAEVADSVLAWRNARGQEAQRRGIVIVAETIALQVRAEHQLEKDTGEP